MRRRFHSAEGAAAPPVSAPFLATLPAGANDRKLAFAAVAVSAVVFLAAVPFAKERLPAIWPFIPIYEAALVVSDLVTAVLLFGQFAFLRSRALLVLAAGYLFTACITVCHALTFPGLFSETGWLGAGVQSTAWLYMFWHAAFPVFVIAYVSLRDQGASPMRPMPAIAAAAAGVIGITAALTFVATGAQAFLPPIMQGNRYTPALIFVVSSVWLVSLLALAMLWQRRPHTVLDLWLMVVMCAWLFDIGLSAVFNAGRFDLGFYAGRIYGLLASTFVLGVLLVENSRLYGRLAQSHEEDRRSLARHAERLKILSAIDRAMVAEQPAEAIAVAVIQPLREVLDVPRAIVNRFDLAAGEVEWVAAAGRRRTHAGPGVRYSLALMGDADALHRGEPQMIDVRALPPGPDAEALLGSGVYYYLVVPMIAGGELLGALSFGGASREFRTEQINIAKEVATQLAIATMQTRLLERVKGQALELEAKVRERTAELESANQDLSSFSYSVSHDLRSPLRAVDGYARMLEEDYASKLDDEGRRLLGVVRDSSRQMGQLIDDLLAFSRLGRQAVVKQSLDMTALAREVIDELRSGSVAHVALAALPAAHADRALIRQVWINLVGNALKYSAKRAAPRIEIGAREEGAENVYWVRDNGAGFDMRYAGKLFGVFQRLHRSDEFEGTGVGLAIVQRVVARHSGRVWAEGRPDEGACFYFCLPR